ncbi:MAG: DUF4058 family protein [Caldilineaceae bacterium]|nr:DUF4058 family protein [Caldilineaceae bacterium]
MMDLPFPGMDPYLETSTLWPDVHNSLIYTFRDQIQQQLNPNYVAVITPYVIFESIEISPVRIAAVPHAAVLRPAPSTAPAAGPAIAIAPAPLTLPAEMNIPTRYARLEVRTAGDETLVTAIELLSPANKRAGMTESAGAAAYDTKRQELFRTSAHLLEIDLLRNGVRPRVARPLPDFLYFVFLSRAERRPTIEIWPIGLRKPLPVVPVPLRRPDADVALDLGAALRQIYNSARYDRRIDYRANPPLPALPAEDAAWLDAHLRERGL